MRPLFAFRSGIYAIRNTSTGKLYVGSAVNLADRISRHKRELAAGHHHSEKLQRAWRKYGADSFQFDVLLHCSTDNLLFYEQRLIDGFNCVANGYNVLPRAGSFIGRPVSEETKAKLRVAHTGKKMSEEMKAKCRERMRGYSPSPEVRAKISASSMGRRLSPEAIAKLRARPISDEIRQRISESLKGRKRPPEIAAKANATKAARKAARIAATRQGELL